MQLRMRKVSFTGEASTSHFARDSCYGGPHPMYKSVFVAANVLYMVKSSQMNSVHATFSVGCTYACNVSPLSLFQTNPCILFLFTILDGQYFLQDCSIILNFHIFKFLNIRSLE